jgi:hypothetical protein
MVHIRKYGRDYSRRRFLELSAKGVFGAGLLTPVWDAVAENGAFDTSYPDELMSIEEYTKGGLIPGNTITADNVDLVQDLLDPVRFMQIKQMGRKLDLVPAVTEMTRLSPVDFVEATLRNRGRAQFDAKGNVVTDEGKPWIGGLPFTSPKNGIECFVGITLSWGRHDVSFYPIKDFEINADGSEGYYYEVIWTEMQPVARVTMDPKPYLPGHDGMLRYQSVVFTYPNDAKGTSFLNSWYYDQTRFPALHGYLPQFKRVRKFPASQRFEPLIAGSTLYLSDAWAAGDPYLTWGNYKIIGRGPFLAGLSGNWHSEHENWEGGTHGGPLGKTFWDTKVELIPEVIVVEAEPTSYPRAPISKKRVWFDARTLLPVGMVSYDRRGEPFKSFDGTYSLYENGSESVKDGNNAYWSWCNVHSHNVQSDRMTRLAQVKNLRGYEMRVNDPDVYENFQTLQALRRMGT